MNIEDGILKLTKSEALRMVADTPIEGIEYMLKAWLVGHPEHTDTKDVDITEEEGR